MTDIILAGVGGQGILTIATIIGEAALRQGLHIKQTEVHGMSQRGGDVHSNIRISAHPIHSGLIGKGNADAVISLEPMEALRYAGHLKKGGRIITSTVPFINISNYPDIEQILAELRRLPDVTLIDAEAIARESGAARSANIVLLGAASPALGIEYEKLEESVNAIFGRKDKAVAESNLRALAAGREAGLTAVKN